MIIDSKVYKHPYYKFAKIITTTPVNILVILLVVGFTIYFDLYAVGGKTTDSIILDLPRGSPTTDAYTQIAKEFGYGKIYPYSLLVIPPENETITNNKFFDDMQVLVYTMAEALANLSTTIDDFTGVMIVESTNVTYDDVVICQNSSAGNEFMYNSSLCIALRYGYNLLVNGTARATLIEITLDWDPLGDNGQLFLTLTRSLIANYSANSDYLLYLSGMPADTLDAIHAVYHDFPIIIGITVGIVLLFVAVSFRSLLIPLRATTTIALTLSWVYGFADLTYNHGLLNWMHWDSVTSTSATMWLAPIASFSILVGIGLDYDIFLLVRTKEFRDNGFSTIDSILLGLFHTGSIITVAGVIMAIAFSGLLFSNIPSLNQLAFFLVFAVLFDTFIVRTILVPAIMSLLGDWSWWPGSVPEPYQITPNTNAETTWSKCKRLVNSCLGKKA